MKPITFRNVPKVTGVTVHSMVKKATTDSAYLHVAGMAVQAISNVRVTTHAAKTHVQQWDLKKGDFVSLSVNMNEEDSLHFLSKTIDMVLPRFKDWRGVRGSSGDSSGNIAFGLTPEQVALYPEIEVNYDMYPPRLIPGCHIFIRTSATNDRDARLLLSAMGLPFYGKLVD
jgi:large subunit ribosomal protein L5